MRVLGHLVAGLTILAMGVVVAAAADAQETGAPERPFLRTELSYSEMLFDRQAHVTDKAVQMLKARADGRLEDWSLYLGGRLSASYLMERTNRAGKFPILSRLPPTHTRGTQDAYGVINEVSLGATLTLPYVSVYVHGEYTELAYRGQDDLQWRKAFVVLGDLDAFPLYAAFGRKTVNFGNFTTYAPFTHSHSSHYFWAQTRAEVLELGYVDARTEIAVSAMKARRGFRVVNSPNQSGAYDNFAANAVHRVPLGEGRQLSFGAGWIKGTIYDSTLAHHPPAIGVAPFWNAAWDAHVTYESPRFDLMAEFGRTVEDWPATFHHVEAATVQGRMRGAVIGKPAIFSLSLSRGVHGTPGTPWERMGQVIAGVEVDVTPHIRLGAEYMYNWGFVPLILPRITADRDVESHTLIFGAELTF
jgi:opacity protein-like surface antigen